MKKILFALGVLCANVAYSDHHSSENLRIIEGRIGLPSEGQYFSDNLTFPDDPFAGGIAPSRILQSINVKPLAYILATAKILWSDRTVYKKNNFARHEYHIITEHFGRTTIQGEALPKMSSAYGICYVDFRTNAVRFPDAHDLKYKEDIASHRALDVGPTHSLKRWKCEIWEGDFDTIWLFDLNSLPQ